ncbi:hypothetical protein WJX72_002162 [[Myrmecia] bisecta]|uniref:Uncharacterized protein n=1 Tax=[Myrmecia] bisecta TaxID=41462 RepID=A0AAW1PJK6_9CHLO
MSTVHLWPFICEHALQAASGVLCSSPRLHCTRKTVGASPILRPKFSLGVVRGSSRKLCIGALVAVKAKPRALQRETKPYPALTQQEAEAQYRHFKRHQNLGMVLIVLGCLLLLRLIVCGFA